MSFRNIIIESPAHISVKQNQLIIRTDGDHSLAVEDINALLIESRQSTITSAALARLGQSGCAVYVCDEKHLPCAVLMPFAQHSRASAVLDMQISATEPLKKRLWQSIVKAKIRNQAQCLGLRTGETEASALTALIPRVHSGDTDNMEAQAARRYFPALFGRGFYRSDEDSLNAALNYGYAILRGCIARSLAVYGFIPSIGLHHRSELNRFNLADDLIEPFRPVVDLLVASDPPEEEGLTSNQKRLLFNCLNLDILSGGQRHTVSYAIERTVQSLARSLSNKKPQLLLPELLELNQHSYE